MAYHRRRRPAKAALRVDTFPLFCVAHGLPRPDREYVFAPPRKFRADWAFVPQRVLVEVNGQIWKLGGHSSGTGLLRDYEKLNLAQVEGWRYLVFTPDQLCSEIAIETLKQVLGA